MFCAILMHCVWLHVDMMQNLIKYIVCPQEKNYMQLANLKTKQFYSSHFSSWPQMSILGYKLL